VVSERETVTVDPIREAAFRSLRRVTENGAYANLVVDATLERYDWPAHDRKLYTTLVYGTLRHRGLLDWVLGKRIGKRFPRRIQPAILAILRMGAYQILCLNRVPKYAAVDESVKLAKKHGHERAAALVNAVLRATIRDAGSAELPDREDDAALYIATRYSHPLWLVQRWLSAWGLERTESVCGANNERAPLTVRANTLRAAPEELEKRLRDENVSVRKKTEVPEELEVVESPRPVRQLRSFRDGLFQVQDASSICAGHLLAPEPGEIVVDMCAGPGGKTTHLAQLMHNSGKVYAVDVKPHKLSLVRDSCRRLGVEIVQCVEGDAGRVSELNLPPADRVIVDAPCSGTGTFRRRLDLRWRLNDGEIERLAGIQKELVRAGASILKPGGVLVYSVCSVDPAETDELVHAETFSSWGLGRDTSCPAWMSDFRTPQGDLRIMTGQDGMDGFFMGKFVKTS
jgi:16S rRNA (cytosine967-C5)-methyltransferase